MREFQPDLFGENVKREITWREQYTAVIASKRWRRLRVKRLANSENCCERCGWKKESWDKSRSLDLHHRTYDRLGEERADDLELVCSVCHIRADQERADDGRKKSADALYDAQFDGWATKVYGEFYDEDEDMHDRFIEWQERQE